MPLSSTLNTNEIKDSGGLEQEFVRIASGQRDTTFKLITELPGYPHRLRIQHAESGSGTSKRRRSVLRFDKTVQGGIDNTKTVTISCYAVLDVPVGNLANYTPAKDLTANLMSFMASLGATTTILFDCTGNGADALVNGAI